MASFSNEINTGGLRNGRFGTSVPMEKLSGQGYELDRMQRNVEQATKEARSYGPVQGRTLKVVADAAGKVQIPHGLGFRPRGYRVNGKNAAADLHGATGYVSDSRLLELEATGAAEFEVEVW